MLETRDRSAPTLGGRDGGTDFLASEGGEAARLIRGFDWAATPLGHPSGWSASLRMVVRFLLANRFPLLLWWGPDYIRVYNDAYAPILGTQHPDQAWACRRTSCRASSSASIVSRARRRAPTRDRASGSRWCRRSSSCTGARPRQRASPAAARRSGSASRSARRTSRHGASSRRRRVCRPRSARRPTCRRRCAGCPTRRTRRRRRCSPCPSRTRASATRASHRRSARASCWPTTTPTCGPTCATSSVRSTGFRADARNSGIRLVAITGYGQETDRERTQAAGFMAHLVKPVEFSALEQLIAGLA